MRYLRMALLTGFFSTGVGTGDSFGSRTGTGTCFGTTSISLMGSSTSIYASFAVARIHSPGTSISSTASDGDVATRYRAASAIMPWMSTAVLENREMALFTDG